MIYFIQCGNGPIKIGYSAETDGCKERLKTMQTGSPYRLRLIGVMYGDYKLEQQLHKIFYESRLSGEWFSPTEMVVNFINSHAYDKLEEYITPEEMESMRILINEQSELASQLLAIDKRGSFYLPAVLNMIERSLLIQALEITRGQQRYAADLLGIASSTISDKIKQLNINIKDINIKTD